MRAASTSRSPSRGCCWRCSSRSSSGSGDGRGARDRPRQRPLSPGCARPVGPVARRDYIAAARIAGVGRGRLLTRHVLPNIGEPLIVNATIGAGGALLAFAGLSFLGLGVQPPAYDWGRLLRTASRTSTSNPLAPWLRARRRGRGARLQPLRRGVARLRASPSWTGASLEHAAGRVAHRAPDAGGASHQTPSPGGGSATDTPVLDVQGLAVSFPTGRRASRSAASASGIGRGEAVGVVGESGCGQVAHALAIARLIEEPGRVTADRLRFLGTDLRRGAGPRSAPPPRHLHGDGVPGPDDLVQPDQRIGRQLAEVAASTTA